MQFKLDGNHLGSAVTSAPYQVSWNSTTATNGSHTLTAVATDTSNNTATATAVTVTVSNVDTTPPTVSITAPTANQTVSGTFNVTATASDNVAVASVQFKLDGNNLGSAVTSAPYQVSWNSTTATNGSHTLTAVATDTSNNTATATAVTVTVSNADTTPPTVSITAPTANQTVSGTINVTATASDNVAVASVQFKLDGNNLGSAVTSAPYQVSWNSTAATNGSHTLTAVATDTSNNTATSTAVTVTVSNVDTTPPTVSITAPTANQTVSGTINVTATASDNVAVASVQFKLDGNNLGSAVTSAPYQVSWNSTTATNGSHTLTAVATDTSNNTATSTAVTVTVSNVDTTPPPLAQGPGGPILLIGSSQDPFTYYYSEILRAEGLNEFAAVDISTVTQATLASYDVVVLAHMTLTSSQVQILTTWVSNGGHLIAMRPDKQLAGLMGLADVSATLSDAYLLINTAANPGTGLVNQTIQYHGTADLYTLTSATSIATLYRTASTATVNPAVTWRNVGLAAAPLPRSLMIWHFRSYIRGRVTLHGPVKTAIGILRRSAATTCSLEMPLSTRNPIGTI